MHTQGLGGIVLFIFLGWFMGRKHGTPSWKKILRLALSQIILLSVCLKTVLAQKFFTYCGLGMKALQACVLEGTSFVFGYIGGGPLPFSVVSGNETFIFLFQALPMIVLMGALSMLFFHWRIIPSVVGFISKYIAGIWCIGGGLATAMAAKLFWGQTDAPLLVKPYLERFSLNELFSVMCAGMATASTTIFALYATLLMPHLGAEHVVMTHIITAAIINIPSALIISELMMPEKGALTEGEVSTPYSFVNSMQALAQGTMDGWNIMWSIGAMLITTLAIVSLLNGILTSMSTYFFGCSCTLQNVMSYLFYPLAWLIGIPTSEALQAGQILAEKTLLNEVVAMVHIGQNELKALSQRSCIILVYSLCNFANFSSIAMQVAAFDVMIASKKKLVAQIAPKAMLGALMAAALSSALVSLWL